MREDAFACIIVIAYVWCIIIIIMDAAIAAGRLRVDEDPGNGTLETLIKNIPNLHVEIGRLTDSVYKTGNNVLVYATNSAAIKPFGLASDMSDVYPYGCPHLRRKRMYPGLDRCRLVDRQPPGYVNFTQAPANTDVNKTWPGIACIITQYGIGKSIEHNQIAKDIAQRSRDFRHVNELMNDTEENRQLAFTSAIKSIVCALTQDESNAKRYKNIILPAGIGRANFVDIIWKRNYLESIRWMASMLQEYNMSVVLLEARQNNSKKEHVKYEVKREWWEEPFEVTSE